MSLTDRKSSAASLARQQRTVGLVIAGAMLGWLVVQYLGSRGFVAPWALVLFDLATLGAMVWAMVVAIRLWRRRADAKTWE